MNRYYYFPIKANNRMESVVKEVYGEIEIISFPLDVHQFNDGDTLIMNSIYDLCLPTPMIKESYKDAFFDLIIEQYMTLHNIGVFLVFEQSPQCNTAFISSLIDSVDFDISAYFETFLKLSIINFDKNKESLMPYRRKHVITAEINGNSLGIKKGTKLTTKKSHSAKISILKLSKDFNGEMSDSEVIKETGISRNTFYKYKKELKNESGKQD